MKLRPTGINENAKKRHKTKFVNFQGSGNGAAARAGGKANSQRKAES